MRWKTVTATTKTELKAGKSAEPVVAENVEPAWAVELPEQGPYAEVGVGRGVTVPLQRFSSVRVDVSVRVPCAPAEVDATFAKANAWVGSRVEALVSEATAALLKQG